ncbi:hypothetical protein [Secundilactobacillus collinoides]|uniref:hypothetical protein n=1 Tax=Secundilactobacillus collinoides TaxID=33960 RepID=UPI000A5DD5B3|nr:hypothetical protein [Secundilactobacillus collinoides]
MPGIQLNLDFSGTGYIIFICGLQPQYGRDGKTFLYCRTDEVHALIFNLQSPAQANQIRARKKFKEIPFKSVFCPFYRYN